MGLGPSFHFGGTSPGALHRSGRTLVRISALYRSTFNISIGIVELEVVDGTCPSSAPSDKPWNTACNSQTTLNDRLSIFSQWRGRQTSSQAGLWHLMSVSLVAEPGIAVSCRLFVC
jgi:hypothetical protein